MIDRHHRLLCRRCRCRMALIRTRGPDCDADRRTDAVRNEDQYAGTGFAERVEIEDSSARKLRKGYEEKEALVGVEVLRETERIIMLNVIDNQWKTTCCHGPLKEGIGLQGYGQKRPADRVQEASFKMFQEMMDPSTTRPSVTFFPAGGEDEGPGDERAADSAFPGRRG